MKDIRAICYFGIFDQGFSRSRTIVKGLRRNGVEVHICCDRTPSLRKYWNLIKEHRALRGKYDAMVVGFPGYFTVFLARMLTTKPLIYDTYISYYDGLADRFSYPESHPKMKFARLVDLAGGFVSQAVLTINEQYKKFFVETIGIPAKKVFVLRKGADTDLFHPLSNQPVVNSAGKLRVGWWGSFIPLHGVDTIIEAAKILEKESVPGEISIEMIGSGQLKKRTQNLIDTYGLKNIAILPRVSYEDLPKKIVSFDVVLGLFGTGPKSARCITNKAYEAIAMGACLVTEDSAANREIFTDGKDVAFVPPGDARALADALLSLKEDPAARKRVGDAAQKLFSEKFTPEKIGAALLDIIKIYG